VVLASVVLGWGKKSEQLSALQLGRQLEQELAALA
jgi:hypothetical protein